MKHRKHKHHLSRQDDAILLNQPVVPPVGPTADAYRIVGYTHGLVGASKPGCDILKPHYDSGLKWPDTNNPLPADPLWGAGVRGGIKWDGTFYRDMIRYPAGGEHFWSAYFKPGSLPGIKLGYWFNFGSGWSHLASDDPAQILAGASQRLYWDAPHPAASRPASPPGGEANAKPDDDSASPLGGEAASTASGEGCWNLVIEATMFVTYAVVNVWTGVKLAGHDPAGIYTRINGCDPLPALSVEVV